MKKSDKTILITGLICLFTGCLGFHRFYLGKYLSGLIMLVTLGGVVIWYLIDLFTILSGNFKDKENLPIKKFI
jgi:TM2 domain-containing membrane protein YozV